MANASLLEEARSYVQQKWIPHALEAYKRYLKAEPLDVEARKEYRTTQRSAKIFAEKDRYIRISKEKNIESNGADLTSILNKGEEFLEENPYNPHIIFKMGKKASQSKEFRLAAYFFDDLLSLVKNTKAERETAKELGIAYVGAHEYDKAEKIFQEYEISKHYAELRKMINDLPAMAASHRIGSKTALETLKTPGQAVQDRNLPDEVADMDRKIKDTTLDRAIRTRALIERVKIYQKERNYQEVARLIENNRDLGEDTDVRLIAAECRIGIEDKILEELESEKDTKKIRQQRKRKWEKSLNEYKGLTRLIPEGHPEVYLSLGESQYQLGIITNDDDLIIDAIETLNHPFKETEMKTTAKIIVGKSFLALRLYHPAKRQFEEILEEIRDQNRDQKSEASYGLGSALEKLGDLEGAQKAFIDIFKQNPRYQDVKQRVFGLENRLNP